MEIHRGRLQKVLISRAVRPNDLAGM
jgi:hypothetical protein